MSVAGRQSSWEQKAVVSHLLKVTTPAGASKTHLKDLCNGGTEVVAELVLSLLIPSLRLPIFYRKTS